MSTEKINTVSQRFAKLAVLGEQVFHTKDLANLWNISNKNTLYTTLKRYAKQKIIFRIYKGLYSIKPVDKIDKYLLGIKAIHSFAYISTETILVRDGIMQQAIDEITLVSSKSLIFSISTQRYRSRQLSNKFLFNDAGIINKNGLKEASVERAVADMLYFNPRVYFDGNSLIDWKKVKIIQKQIGYK